MSGQVPPPSDDDLMRELGDALDSAGPISDSMITMAQGAFAWLDVDTDLELAMLVFDSRHDQASAVRGQAAAGTRHLVFDGATASLELQLDGDVLVSRLSPPQPARVTIVRTDRTADEYDTDSRGQLEITLSGSGAIAMTCRNETFALSTGWLRL